MSAYDWDELRALSLARQFPELPGRGSDAVVETVRRIGPIQSQTARSPYAAMGARLPGATHEAITTAYESLGIVRGSTIRGTVHTSTADHHALLDATTRVGQRAIWVRHLALQRSEVEDLWHATEHFAAETWRTTDELLEHLRGWLAEHDEEIPESVDRGLGRYLTFGHGGLLRRPLKGSWSGQGAPGYRTATAVLPDREVPVDPLSSAVRLHLASYGPASRRDVAWWSGLGLRQVDSLLDGLDLTWRDGPGGLPYADVPDALPRRDLPGVRLVPEFDAVLCGYDPKLRDRFVRPDDHPRLWNKSNGYMLAPMLVDGQIGGYWRIEGTGRERTLAVSSFTGSRKPRRAELDEPVAALSAALDVRIGSVTVTRV
ncbi:MAG TPA: winged helix DNA-binding domain-containing protein [Nocardioides sp.]|nr:winged helix DNA-binding domain-containing protein [Nocardioides sp.]